MVFAIRGATTVTSDTREEIEQKTTELARALWRENALDTDSCRCVSVLLSSTRDIRSFYPARALRESGLTAAPLFSCLEPDVEGALGLCIRLLVTAESDEAREARHVYLHEAKKLRPDLAQ